MTSPLSKEQAANLATEMRVGIAEALLEGERDKGVMDFMSDTAAAFEAIATGQHIVIEKSRLDALEAAERLAESQAARVEGLEARHEKLTGANSPYADMAVRLAESEADARRYRKARLLGKTMKLYVYDDPNDACSGDWHYDPSPETFDEIVDSIADQPAAEKPKEKEGK